MERGWTSHRKMKYFWSLLRISLGIIFIYASYYKITSPGAFAHQIYNFKLLPPWAINPIAITLPWLQFFCGIALIINKGAKGASFCILVMLVVFQSAIASALFRGLNIACGCFKSGGSSATWWTFGRDSLFLLLAGLQFWRAMKRDFI